MPCRRRPDRMKGFLTGSRRIDSASGWSANLAAPRRNESWAATARAFSRRIKRGIIEAPNRHVRRRAADPSKSGMAAATPSAPWHRLGALLWRGALAGRGDLARLRRTELPSEKRSRVRADFLPLSRPSIGPQEIEEVTACLRSGWLTSGPRVTRFEEAFAETVGVAHAVAMSSATAGLHLALLAAGVGPGDEVVTTPMTWASTGNMILAVGARPVFVDVDPGTLNIDPEAVASAITPRTRARPIGGGSAAAVFSFHPIKAITTGEGGMVATDDAALADRLRLLRFHGIARDAWSRYGRRGNPGYDIVALGFKYNMTDLQAALGLAQLARLQEFVEARTRIAAWYREALARVPAVEMLAPVSYPARHAWHLLVVRLGLEALRLGRDEVMDGLLAANIGVGLHFKALHLHRLYREQLALRPDALPHATSASERILSLPLFPGMTREDVEDVASALAEILRRHAA